MARLEVPVKKLLSRLGFGKTSLIVLAAVLVLAGVYKLAVFELRELNCAAHRRECARNLKQIALALHGYHDTYGCLPPSYLADEQGRPIHSWRVLILPFMDAQEVYDAYHFDEPWDGPHNKLLLEPVAPPRRPYLPFKCWSDQDGHPETTSYVAVTGPGTAWPSDRPVRLRDLGHFSEIPLVVEVKHSGIPWIAPVDLSVDRMSFRINDPLGNCLGSDHCQAGASVAFADGAVHFLEVNPYDPSASIPTDEESLRIRFHSAPTRDPPPE